MIIPPDISTVDNTSGCGKTTHCTESIVKKISIKIRNDGKRKEKKQEETQTDYNTVPYPLVYVKGYRNSTVQWNLC